MKRFIYVIFVVVFLIAGGAGWAFSQEETGQEMDIYYTYGTVVAIAPDRMEIIEYDDETYEEVQSEYQLTSQTEWIDGLSYQDIQIEDEVDLEYQIVEEKRIVLSVEKYNQVEEEQTEAE
jgi:hypothetical protein